ncbi:MAG: GyrI-like domain-containing protein [Fulvivirga sp.]|uniref:GyrI-like domain-containing protein n=1 Tax=Fulvivirga sp. TaxID=1931237 RepID=UPI0032EF5156
MKQLITLILTLMTTLTVTATETTVYELVVYRIKGEYQDTYDEVLNEAREHIMKFPGIIEHQTFKSSEDELLFMDLVKWNSLEEARDAAQKVEQMMELAPFMAAFEEIKFMDHFELFNSEAMNKLDLTKTDKAYYLAKNEPQIVNVYNYNYLSISGVSAPEEPIFNGAIEAIYSVAYGVKFSLKEQNKDFVVPKMEAQWWVEGNLPFEETPRKEWHWNIVIPMPEFVAKADVEEAIQNAIAKKGSKQISEVEFKPLNEGKSIQVLHIGSYDAEGPTLEKLFTYAAQQGLEINGKHHEIYISDPRKTATENLKTIIRYPVK